MSEINTAEFMRSFDEWAEKSEKAYFDALKSTSLDMFSSIVKRTPVDTGRARGNWQISFDSVPAGEVGSAESWKRKGSEGVRAPSESASSREAFAKATAKTNAAPDAFSYVALVNNLPYIQRLEFSAWSDQMPAGMVRVTLSEFERKLAAAARDNQL